MKIDFSSLPLSVIPNMKGGEKEFSVAMHDDPLNRIMHGTLIPGASIGLHTHDTSSEIIYVLSGTGTCSINSSSTKVSETDMFYTVTPSTDGGTVTIKNTGSGTLAITELKFTDLKSTT